MLLLMRMNTYGDLEQYLETDGFDLIEIDTANLQSAIDDSLIISVDDVVSIPSDTMPTARSAVQANGHLFGYPTLACGNFIISLSPSSDCTCPLRESRNELLSFETAIGTCNNLIQSPYKRLIGGKMNDDSGWYCRSSTWMPTSMSMVQAPLTQL